MGDKFFIKSIEKVKINSNIPEDLTVKNIVEKPRPENSQYELSKLLYVNYTFLKM